MSLSLPDVEERLSNLDQLHARGLIQETEYQDLRKTLLSSFIGVGATASKPALPTYRPAPAYTPAPARPYRGAVTSVSPRSLSTAYRPNISSVAGLRRPHVATRLPARYHPYAAPRYATPARSAYTAAPLMVPALVDGTPRDPVRNSTVTIRPIPVGCTEADVLEALGNPPGVLQVTLYPAQEDICAAAEVTFERPRLAEEAVAPREVPVNGVLCRIALNSSLRPPQPTRPNNRLAVFNLPLEISQPELEGYFAHLPGYVSCSISTTMPTVRKGRPKGPQLACGIIEFDSVETATMMRQDLQGLVIDGHLCHIQFSR